MAIVLPGESTEPYKHTLDPTQRLVYEARPSDMLLWSKQYSFGNTGFNGEIETYLPGNVYLSSSGELVLEARNTGGGKASTGYNGKYTSGMVAGYNCLLFRYGYIEVCAKLPAGQGVWPAIWQLVDPSIGNKFEIDLCEIFADGTVLNNGIHFNQSGGGVGSDGGHTQLGFDLSQGYHYYAVDWQPSYIQFYLDGVPIRRITNTAEFAPYQMYPLLNIAISGIAVGYLVPPDSQFPIQSRIRSWRLWQGIGSQYQLSRFNSTPNYGSYRSAVTLDGASHYYRLDGATPVDSIGAANGTITGGVTPGQSAIIADGSASTAFDGSTGYITLPSSVDPSGWSALTVEVWFANPGATPVNGRIVSNAHTDQSNTGFQLMLNPGTSSLASLATTGKTANLYWNQALSPNTPYHYVLTYDSTHSYAYLNGVQVGSTTQTGTIISSGLPITIGRGAYGNNYWSGQAGHVAIYPLALTATQVAAHYSIGLTAPVVLASLALSDQVVTKATLSDKAVSA